MIAAALVALVVAPWSHPLAFRPLPGWDTGSSGNKPSAYGGHPTRAVVPLESAAWIAHRVPYLDLPTADPPNKTLQHLPRRAVIVWAVIYSPAHVGQKPVRLAFKRAKRFDCCEATHVPGGGWELTGVGRGRAYSVIVRIYFGSRPTSAMKAQAQRALTRLRLPPPR